MAKWWTTWGATLIWGLSVAGSVALAYRALERRLDQMNADIALRLQRIEIVLGIDPLLQDVPTRSVREVSK